MKRARFTKELKNSGNRLHNVKAMQNNIETELLHFKHSNNGKFNVNTITYVYCKYCFGLFKKENLYKHSNVCPMHEVLLTRQPRVKI